MRSRVTAASPAPGTWARSVVAMTLWPVVESSPASSSRRSGSSSLITSSSSISGVRRRSSASTARSARSSASRARRCWPCDPKTLSSRLSCRIASSSRCGPWPVNPRSRSRGSRSCSSATNWRSSRAPVRGRYSMPVSPPRPRRAACWAKGSASRATASPRSAARATPLRASSRSHAASVARDA